MEARAIGWFLKLFRAIPIRPRSAREALTRTIEARTAIAAVAEQIGPAVEAIAIGLRTLQRKIKKYELE